MQIEKNMYIRTKKGYIAKIKEIHDDYYALDKKILSLSTVYSEEELELNDIILKEDIKKASYNIIDLIEVDDIITLKGDDDVYKILSIPDKEIDNDDFYLVYEGREFEDIKISPKLMSKNIKSIVTKEQFKNMEYKVK